ncbi:unnamed protein product, partial [Nesidiocoris tenuis]
MFDWFIRIAPPNYPLQIRLRWINPELTIHFCYVRCDAKFWEPEGDQYVEDVRLKCCTR